MARDSLVQFRISGHRVQISMEGAMKLDGFSIVGGTTNRGIEFSQGEKLAVVNDLCCQPDGAGFEDSPHLIEIVDVFGGDRGDERAAIRMVDNPIFSLQLPEGLAERTAAHAVPCRDFFLR